MTKEDITFTAGFFLGEANVLVRKNKGAGHTAWVSISQLDREPLDRLQQLWGGKVKLFKYYGKPNMWQWPLYGRLALPCLEAILPVMRNWSEFETKRIEKYEEFFALANCGDWRARAEIVAWFKTCVEDHKKACHARLEASMKEGENNGQTRRTKA